MMYKLSTNGLNFIKSFENLRLETYRCSAGVLTIGYGHTGKDVKVGMRITEKQALSLLAKDTDFASRYVNSLQIAKTQNQFDALTSFVFNVGCGQMRTSTLLKRIRQGADEKTIRYEWQRWNKAKGVVQNGLIRRRKEEADLYFKK